MVSLITQLSMVRPQRRCSTEVREFREVRLRTEERRPLAFQVPRLLPKVQPVCGVRPSAPAPNPCGPPRLARARGPVAVAAAENVSGAEISPNHLQLELGYWPLPRQGSALLHPRGNSIRE